MDATTSAIHFVIQTLISSPSTSRTFVNLREISARYSHRLMFRNSGRLWWFPKSSFEMSRGRKYGVLSEDRTHYSALINLVRQAC